MIVTMSNILSIGVAVLDISSRVCGYPEEDDEVRALEQRVSRGGNATNTLVVLSQLDHHCSWAGVIADDLNSVFIREDLGINHVGMEYVSVCNNHKTPVSHITINSETGSRTIVHYSDLPELTLADFKRIDLGRFDWVHFEGRNIGQTENMLMHIKDGFDSLPISLEVEKPRGDIDRLFCFADILLFSRVYARSAGFADAQSLLESMHRDYPETLHYCTWGGQGAYLMNREGKMVHSPASNIPEIVDTVGAGDTFNAGIIHAHLASKGEREGLALACKLAGRKCMQTGFDGLG